MHCCQDVLGRGRDRTLLCHRIELAMLMPALPPPSPDEVRPRNGVHEACAHAKAEMGRQVPQHAAQMEGSKAF